MKLALYQGPSADGDVDGAFARLEHWLRVSALAGARMLVMPELFLPGYNRPDLHRALAQPLDGDWMARVANLARVAGCGVTLGWAERAGARIYNSASAFDAGGKMLAHYRKIQLYGAMETAGFAAGDRAPAVFPLEGRRAGLLICYDIEFPHHAAALAGAGADLLLVPTANPRGYEHVQQVLVPARAHENRACVAYANYCGSEAGLVYGGGSVIVGPDARVVASAGVMEALLIAELPGAEDLAVEGLSNQAADRREPVRE
jgi:predicted amidohydrolase